MTRSADADGPPIGEGRRGELRRLAYIVLAPALGRRRRLRLADSLAREADAAPDPDTARTRLIRGALHAGRGSGWLPAVVQGGAPTADAAARAADRALAGMVPAARAAFALIHLEQCSPRQAATVLAAVGVHDPDTAVTIAERTPLDPATLQSMVIPLPAATGSTRLVAAVAAGLVVAVAAPVIAVTAFGDGEDSEPAVASVQESPPSAAQAIAAGKRSLKEARATAADAAGPALRSDLDRALEQVQAALRSPALTAKETRQLRKLRAAINTERERLRD